MKVGTARVAIIGGGFTGLSAAYYLQKAGHETTVFERTQYLGGLASGIKHALQNPPENWEWDIEQFYHHWFTNDTSVFELGEQIGVRHKFIIAKPSTDIIFNDQIYPFDSPLALIKFPHLSVIDRIKTGFAMTTLKYYYNMKNSKKFENITAVEYLQKHSSKQAYERIWEPLLKGKFSDHYKKVNMRWFWARIYKRTPSLAYYKGGMSAFIADIATAITDAGGSIVKGTPIEIIKECKECSGFHIGYAENNADHQKTFDKVIVTSPPHLLPKLYPNLPHEYIKKLAQHEGIGAYVLVLRLHHQLMPKTYWLSVNDERWPFLAIVEHTNFMPKERYGGENIVYIGDYLDKGHPNMQKSKEELIRQFTPYIKKINPLFSEESIIDSYIFKANYAQPIPKLNHETNILPFTTPIEGLYLATMAQVYPWDRGTNYAIEMGKEVAESLS